MSCSFGLLLCIDTVIPQTRGIMVSQGVSVDGAMVGAWADG